jgi:hypothetical protein
MFHNGNIAVNLFMSEIGLDDQALSSLESQDRIQVFENEWKEKAVESWICYIFEYFIPFLHKNRNNNHR